MMVSPEYQQALSGVELCYHRVELRCHGHFTSILINPLFS